MDIDKIKEWKEQIEIVEDLYGKGVITLDESNGFTGKRHSPVPANTLSGKIRTELGLPL